MLNLSIELTDITLTLLKSSETVTSGEVIATSISIDLVFSEGYIQEFLREPTQKIH